MNLMWYTIFVIGYRLPSLRFVRGGETNDPYHRELALTIIADVIAGSILYFVCRWLDSKE